MKLHLRKYDLQLRHTFRIASDSRDVQQTLIVGLEQDGIIGYGEATANKFFRKPLYSIVEALESARRQIESTALSDVQSYIHQIAPLLSSNSFALCALDVAAHDLYGKILGKSTMDIWRLTPAHIPTTNYTIGIDSIPKMVEKIKEFPWPIYKIKLGTDDDLCIVKSLREHTDAVFRVDANCAWTVQQTIDYSHVLKQLNVELIEQPLKADDWTGMKEVYEHSALPVIADESCLIESDVLKCQGYFHGINIKLMKCGGMIPARRMINQARYLNLKVMMGCMTESSVGIAAISQFLPLVDYIDMDGSMLISNDIASGPVFENGKIFLSGRAGNGAKFL